MPYWIPLFSILSSNIMVLNAASIWENKTSLKSQKYLFFPLNKVFFLFIHFCGNIFRVILKPIWIGSVAEVTGKGQIVVTFLHLHNP